MNLDNTYREIFNSCPRKYFLARELSLAPAVGSNALRYGSTWHAFIEGYYSSIQEEGWAEEEKAFKRAISYGKVIWDSESHNGQVYNEDDYRTFRACMESFLEYVTEFSMDRDLLKVIKTEQVFRHQLLLTKEELEIFPELESQEIVFTGRLDIQVNLSGLPWIIEAKTTGASIALMASRLTRSPQILGYSYAGKNALEFPTQGCLVSIHQLSCRKKQDGTWGKLTRAFSRIPNIFTEKDLDSWRKSFLFTYRNIILCKRNNTWPMIHDNCYRFGRCQFCDLCERNISLEELRKDIANNIIPEGYLYLPKDILNFSTKKLIEEAKSA